MITDIIGTTIDRNFIIGMLVDKSISNSDKLEIKKFDEECLAYFGEEWETGNMTLINEEYFTDYAYDMMVETFSIDKIILPYIDVEAFARDLKYDYMGIQLFGMFFYGQ